MSSFSSSVWTKNPDLRTKKNMGTFDRILISCAGSGRILRGGDQAEDAAESVACGDMGAAMEDIMARFPKSR